jgi:hypothetical protein
VNKIPAISQFNFPDGVWFIFRDGDREIAAHNSILCLERIFINGKLASKRRSIFRISNHYFVFEDNSYNVKIVVSDWKSGRTECFLKKDDIYIKKCTMLSEINVKRLPLRKQLFFFLLLFLLYSPIIVLVGYVSASVKTALLFTALLLSATSYTFSFVYIMKKYLKVTFEEN